VTGGRIALDEAMRMFLAHAFSRMPPELRAELERKMLEKLPPKEPGLMWWADEPLMVLEEDGALVVERAEVEQIIARVKPYDRAGC
jgi:hypothetical protein